MVSAAVGGELALRDELEDGVEDGREEELEDDREDALEDDREDELEDDREEELEDEREDELDDARADELEDELDDLTFGLLLDDFAVAKKGVGVRQWCFGRTNETCFVDGDGDT